MTSNEKFIEQHLVLFHFFRGEGESCTIRLWDIEVGCGHITGGKFNTSFTRMSQGFYTRSTKASSASQTRCRFTTGTS